MHLQGLPLPGGTAEGARGNPGKETLVNVNWDIVAPLCAVLGWFGAMFVGYFICERAEKYKPHDPPDSAWMDLAALVSLALMAVGVAGGR